MICHVKLRAIALPVLAATLGASAPLDARPISYVCPYDEYKVTITVDLARSTVRKDDNGNRDIPATITPASVDWRETTATDASVFHIDRKSGVYTIQATLRSASGSARTYPKVTYHCTLSAHP